MKFKVRGLVFVGFAAAILSANAMAASDNTVTSKSYVDTHFQNVADRVQDLTATGDAAATQYPSVAAVKTALQETGATVQSGTLTVNQNNQLVGTFSANQATTSPVTLNIVAPDWNAATGTAGYIANKPTVDTTFNAESNNAATSAAIASYVTNAVSAEANVQANWTETDTTSDAYIQNKPPLGTASAANVSEDGVADGETGLTTGDQVYDYVQSQTNGQVLPMPSSCTATNPCALITDGTSGSPMWVPIAQTEAQVGA